MKTRYALLALAALLTPAFAGTTTVCEAAAPAPVPAPSCDKLTGSLTVGYDTNYVGRGIVISHSVAEGDSSEFVALKLNYDFGKKSYWSFDSTIAYKMVSSGHVLYGPTPYKQLNAAYSAYGITFKERNIENEFAVVNALKYTGKYGHISFGHDFVHGGLLGAMAKHFRNQGASVTNEAFIAPVLTPTKWFETGLTVRYSFDGIQGWWFEPYATFKAPIIGTPEDIKVAGLLTFAMSATYGYFDEAYGACANGAQAWWIKLSTPWFVNDSKSFILTPSISLNWLGCGAQKANRVAAMKPLNSDYVPFRNFAVVAGLSATYKF